MIRGFFPQVDWKLSKKKQGNRFLNLEYEFWKEKLIKMKSNCLESRSRWEFSISSLDLELVPKKTDFSQLSFGDFKIEPRPFW